MVVVELAALLFEAASVNVPSATETDPVPLCVFVVGVNTAVYDVTEPVNDDSIPPLAVISVTTKLVDASDKVNVNVDVSPDFSVDALAAIETVGAVESTVTASPADVDVTVESVNTVVDTAVTSLFPADRTPVSQDHAPVVALAVHVLPDATLST